MLAIELGYFNYLSPLGIVSAGFAVQYSALRCFVRTSDQDRRGGRVNPIFTTLMHTAGPPTTQLLSKQVLMSVCYPSQRACKHKW